MRSFRLVTANNSTQTFAHTIAIVATSILARKHYLFANHSNIFFPPYGNSLKKYWDFLGVVHLNVRVWCVRACALPTIWISEMVCKAGHWNHCWPHYDNLTNRSNFRLALPWPCQYKSKKYIFIYLWPTDMRPTNHSLCQFDRQIITNVLLFRMNWFVWHCYYRFRSWI